MRPTKEFLLVLLYGGMSLFFLIEGWYETKRIDFYFGIFMSFVFGLMFIIHLIDLIKVRYIWWKKVKLEIEELTETHI